MHVVGLLPDHPRIIVVVAHAETEPAYTLVGKHDLSVPAIEISHDRDHEVFTQGIIHGLEQCFT